MKMNLKTSRLEKYVNFVDIAKKIQIIKKLYF